MKRYLLLMALRDIGVELLQELKSNRVQRAIVEKVNDRICEPLDLALRDPFPRADESIREATKSIEGKNRDPKPPRLAMENLQQLLTQLGNVLDAMQDITTINNLIAKLVELEQSESAEMKRLEELKNKLQEDLLKGLLK